MKQIILVMAMFSFIEPSQAEFMVEANYSWLWHSENTYTSSSGKRATGAANTDLRFFGLGGRYVFRNFLGENVNVEPFIKIFGPAKDFDRNKLFLFEVGGALSYSLGRHTPFLSLLVNQAELVPETELNYKPGIGFQLGYRFELDNHNLMLMHSWKSLNSENTAGGINDQATTLSVFEFAYGFSFR